MNTISGHQYVSVHITSTSKHHYALPSQHLFLRILFHSIPNLILLPLHRPIEAKARLLSRMDLPALSLLFFPVLIDNLTTVLLEEDRCLLVLGVQETRPEHAAVQICLCVVTEHLVLTHDTLIHISDEMELLVCARLGLEDLVVTCRCVR